MHKTMNKRAERILALVATKKIHSQEELTQLLAEEGVYTTQATLSRDLTKLQIFKQTDAAGESCYQLSTSGQEPSSTPGSGILNHILSVSFSGQMGVITTHAGCANMVGALIDGHSHPKLMGTLAGDNILLLILRQGTTHAGIVIFLESLLPGIGNKVTTIDQ